jgi:hypothetical protein
MLLALHLTSCTFWTATKTPLPELTGGEKPPALVRVETIDGETLELTDPRVHNDTLIGGAVPDTGWVFVALADISKVEVRKKDALKTGLAVVLAAGVVVALAALCKNPDNCTTEDEEE